MLSSQYEDISLMVAFLILEGNRTPAQKTMSFPISSKLFSDSLVTEGRENGD